MTTLLTGCILAMLMIVALLLCGMIYQLQRIRDHLAFIGFTVDAQLTKDIERG